MCLYLCLSVPVSVSLSVCVCAYHCSVHPVKMFKSLACEAFTSLHLYVCSEVKQIHAAVENMHLVLSTHIHTSLPHSSVLVTSFALIFDCLCSVCVCVKCECAQRRNADLGTGSPYS